MSENNPSVSRQEFEQHRQQVSEDIANLAAAIREEGNQRALDTQTLRGDIKDIVKTVGKPQYQALAFAFGVFSFVCASIAAVYMWGANAHWDAQASESKAISRLLEAQLNGRYSQHNERLIVLERELFGNM